MLLIIFSIGYASVCPHKNKLVNTQELLLLLNLTIMYAVSYQGSGSVFSTVTNVMIGLAFIQICTIVFYHFLTYSCHCNVVTALQTVKEKLMSSLHVHVNSDNHLHSTSQLNIPDHTFSYS